MPVTQICNLFIKLSNFPKDCKVAKFKRLCKKRTETDTKNFRPISLLLIVFKIMKKVMHDQTINYLTENNIFYKYQSGFCKNHLPDSSLSCFTGKILIKYLLIILINMQKAFDTIIMIFYLKKCLLLDFPIIQ